MPRIALFDSERAPTVTSAGDVTWARLCERLSTPRPTPCAPCPGHSCAHKRGPAWSPIAAEPGAPRTAPHAVTLAVYDLDGSEPPWEALDASGHAYLAHPTHAPGHWRLVLPLESPVPADQWRPFWASLARSLGLTPDPACSDPGRLFFLPSWPAGAEPPPATRYANGPQWPANPSAYSNTQTDVTLRDHTLGAPPHMGVDSPPRGVDATPPKSDASTAELSPKNFGRDLPRLPVQTPPAGGFDLIQLWAHLQAVRRPESRALTEALRRGLPVPCPQGHDHATNRIAGVLVGALPYDVTDEQIEALATQSIAAWGCPKGLEHDLSRFREQIKRQRAIKQERDTRALRQEAELVEAAESLLQGPDDDPWIWQVNKDGTRTLKTCEANLVTILERDQCWSALKFDVVEKTLLVAGTPLENFSVQAYGLGLADWLQRSKYRLSGYHVATLEAAILNAARRRQVDPLREGLLALSWDGTPRLDTMLTRYLGAEDTEYHRAVGRKWLISAVARALEPGCKADCILILEGVYGIGKSPFGKVIGGENFSDSPVDFRSKDSRALASRFWVLEMAELGHMTRVEAESLKAWLSARDDAYRPPYGRTIETFPRRCVFLATTNREDEYLQEPNRREWCVRCGTETNIPLLREERDQLLAEAVVAYQAGEKWWLEGAIETEARAAAQERGITPDHAIVAERILAWYTNKPLGQRPEWTTTAEIAVALGMVNDRSAQIRIGRALKSLGVRRVKQRVNGVLIWAQVFPAGLRVGGNAGVDVVSSNNDPESSENQA